MTTDITLPPPDVPNTLGGPATYSADAVRAAIAAAQVPPLTEAQQDEIRTALQMYEEARLLMNAATERMGRSSRYVGWMAVVLSACAAAALPLNETLPQIVAGWLQLAVWIGVALINFGAINKLLGYLIRRKQQKKGTDQ